MLLRAQAPAINDVANQIERLAFHRVEEIDQHFRIAAARAQMDIRYPDRAVFTLGLETAGFRQIQPGRHTAHFNGLHCPD